MGQLMTDMNHLKDELKDKDAEMVHLGQSRDSYKDDVLWLAKELADRESEILGLKGEMERLQTRVNMSNGALSGIQQQWDEAKASMSRVE